MYKKIPIAIIDSGINNSIKSLNQNIRHGYEITMSEDKISIGDDYTDRFGHGTNCAHIILKHCAQVELIPIKIINNHGFSNSALLIEALKLCFVIPVKIISISLSVISSECNYESLLYEICKKLDEQNKIICISENNNCINSIPARFDNVIGVRATLNKYFLQVRCKEEIQVIADGSPEFVLNEKGTYNLFRGNSKANAVVAGVIAGNLFNKNDLTRKEILELLQKKYKRKYNDKKEGSLNRIFVNKEELKIAQEICCMINRLQNKNLNIIQLVQVPIMCPVTGYTYFNIFELLEKIKEYYGMKEIKYDCLSTNKICTLYNLVHYIQEVLV